MVSSGSWPALLGQENGDEYTYKSKAVHTLFPAEPRTTQVILIVSSQSKRFRDPVEMLLLIDNTSTKLLVGRGLGGDEGIGTGTGVGTKPQWASQNPSRVVGVGVVAKSFRIKRLSWSLAIEDTHAFIEQKNCSKSSG
jgi:hypothetical protein